jgi:alpha,alpha-trehalase
MAKINNDAIKSALVATAGTLIRSRKSPDELMGELFSDVQAKQVFADGKTFADLVPRRRLKSIIDEYKLSKHDPHFDFNEFLGRHFYDLTTTIHKKEPFKTGANATISHQISQLWEYLERRNRRDRGSLVALPYIYVVPGGRFNEQFYWDSYFIMLGLAAEGKWQRVEGMLKNCAYMIRKYGYVPTANRTYFLSRSQPPVFVLMVKLLVEHKGKKVLREYLPCLVSEYRFWMKGKKKLLETENFAYRRVVQMPDGALLNRYYDNKITPRPESLREDTETAVGTRKKTHQQLFLHLRAAAESGWDFSSRWFRDPRDIRTIRTTDIIPIDLNALLYTLESTIAEAYSSFRNPFMVRKFKNLAGKRQQAINTYLWDESNGFYRDYDFHDRQPTQIESLAAVFPLYVGIASQDQAGKVAEKLEKEFLKTGGLVTTLHETGQQWDGPNGWAPLQWIAIEGLRAYGHDALADKIKQRWMALNEKVFKNTHRLIEKYNVADSDGLGGGGEYTLQDGFGWTNGVYTALKHRK